MTHSEKVVNQFLRQEQCNKNIAKYVLRHAGKGKLGNEVETFEITESLSIDELGNLANLILGRAQLDADGLGPAIQRYSLISYYADEKASGRISFRLRGNADMDIDGEDEAGEEAPNLRGLTSQLMRHNEANNRTMVGSVGSLMGIMVRRMESQDKVIEKLMEDRQKSWEIVEEAMSNKHERDMERVDLDAKNERIAFGIKKVSMLLPVIMDKLSGGKLPSKDDPTMLMLDELFGSMNTEQMETIRRGMSAEQQIVLFNLLKKFQARKQLSNGDSTVEKKEN